MTWTLAGRYRLTSSVASGPTGELWRAVDGGTGHPVAVKLLHAHLAGDARVLDQLLRARRALSALWHPGIARLLDVVHEPPALALVADLVPGADLGQVLASSGRLAPARAAALAAVMAEALDAAHRAGVVHGDLKPSNVIVSRHGGEAVRLTDFSVAILVRSAQRLPEHTQASPYAPSWLIEGGVPTPAGDVHALATVLHEMLTGTPSPADAGARVEPRLRELIAQCRDGHQLAPPSAADVAERLRELAPHLPRIPATRGLRPGGSRRGGAGAGHRPAHGAPEDLAAAEPGLEPGRDRPGRDQAGRGQPGRGDPDLASRDRPERAARGRRLAVAAAGLVLVAAGIAAAVGLLNQPAPDEPPDERNTVAATGAPPTLPAEATELTQVGGTAFVSYWFSTLGHAIGTGDTTGLVEVTSPECVQCGEAMARIEAVHGKGDRLRGGGYVIRNVTIASFWSQDRPVYDVTLDREARTVVDSAGQERPDLAGLSFTTCTMALEWSEERWLIREIITPGCVG